MHHLRSTRLSTFCFRHFTGPKPYISSLFQVTNRALSSTYNQQEEHNNNQQKLQADSFDSWGQSMIQRYSAKLRHTQLPSNLCTIYRVPDSIRRVDEDAYVPIMLSIGPYHRDKNNLQAMEDHKWRNMQSILSQDPKMRMGDYLKEITPLESQARSCYSEIIDMGSQEFVEMMVLDGCFILSILLSNQRKVGDEWFRRIYGARWNMPIIIHDMLLLENQLPFFVLQRLFELIAKSTSSSLEGLVAHLLDDLMPNKKNAKTPPLESVHHLLHLFHRRHLPSIKFNENSLTTTELQHHERRSKTIPSAVEIRQSGIHFRASEDECSILDVKFTSWFPKSLSIPTLSINYYTNSLFRNLIALEQCNYEHGTYFTSHAVFMNCLVDTPEDVALLKRHRVIEHGLGSDEDVARLLNRLCRGVGLDSKHCHLSKVFQDVKNVHKRKWRGLRAIIVREYFSDPLTSVKVSLFIVQVMGGFLALKLGIDMGSLKPIADVMGEF